MTSADVGALAFLAIPAGIAIAAWSKLSRKSADAAAADPPRPIAELVPGAPATIEGKAWAGFTSPTGTAERVVTVEEVWVRHQDGYSDSREHYGSMVEGTHWSLSRSDCWGGFFIDDASGRALVLPNMASLKELTHQKVEAEPSLAPGAEWRKDRWIEAGDAVCVHGVPRTLREAIEHLRARPQGTNIANELLDELLKKEAAGENLPCFFDCPDFVVAGRPYAEYRERSQAAADEKLLLGLALAAGGVLVLVALWLGVY